MLELSFASDFRPVNSIWAPGKQLLKFRRDVSQEKPSLCSHIIPLSRDAAGGLLCILERPPLPRGYAEAPAVAQGVQDTRCVLPLVTSAASLP